MLGYITPFKCSIDINSIACRLIFFTMKGKFKRDPTEVHGVDRKPSLEADMQFIGFLTLFCFRLHRQA